MYVEPGQNQKQSARGEGSGLFEELTDFKGSPEDFLWRLLEFQCSLCGAEEGAVLSLSDDSKVNVLSYYPAGKEGRRPPQWVGGAVEFVRVHEQLEQTVVEPLHSSDQLYGQPAKLHVIVVPLRMNARGGVFAALKVKAVEQSSLSAGVKAVELTKAIVNSYELRLTVEQKQGDLVRLQSAMEPLSSVNREERFLRAAMAFCNELASQWKCRRTSIGLLKGRYVQLKALSHTENFSRKMRLVQDIESAMEECLDQNVEVIYPAEEESTFIYRSTEELSNRYGPSSILSLPLRRGGEPAGVVTLERGSEQPFSTSEIEALRLTCELCTTPLVNLYEQDRWFGAKALAQFRRLPATVVGPKHTLAKAGGLLVFVALMFLIFAKGQYKAEAPFVLEATVQQSVPAPFGSFIKTVNVVKGDKVEGGRTVMAELETAELLLKLSDARADRQGYLKEQEDAMQRGETAAAQIAGANAEKAKANMDLLNYKIEQAQIVAPISGIVVKGDLEHNVGAPVETGDILFEIASLESLRAELAVPEDQIIDIEEGQKGYLATVSYPGRKINFEVERVNPIAEVVKDRNVFKVRVRLEKIEPWMRPGMEGISKVKVGRRSYAWIWTHRFVNWLRMKLWL